MSIPAIARVLAEIRPGAEYNVRGPSLADIEWLDQVQTVPSAEEVEAASLAVVKVDHASRLDADAEAARLRFLTPGAGMMMTYQEKFAQAQAVAAVGEAEANALSQVDREEQFPTLAASVGIEAETLWDCAHLVLQKYAEFAQISLVIERTRLSAKKAISDASDAAAVRAAYEAITWPTP